VGFDTVWIFIDDSGPGFRGGISVDIGAQDTIPAQVKRLAIGHHPAPRRGTP
jgi:hypothetical protein